MFWRLMMSTYTQILYQIIFSTKERENVLSQKTRPELFKYIWGILKNKNCHLYRLNGIENHIHILISLHPSIALADLIKDIKVASSKWIKDKQVFKGFRSWQAGYGAFTYSFDAKDKLVEYIKNQEEHHKIISFEDEYRKIMEEFKILFNEKYLF